MNEAQLKQLVEDLRSKYGDRRQSEYEQEKVAVRAYLDALVPKIEGTYALQKPLAVGGTGIVFLGAHTRFKQDIVLKFNRPNLTQHERSMVENEARILPVIHHPNIVRVLDLGAIDVPRQPKLTYLIEPFVTGSAPLFTHDKTKIDDTWLNKRIEDLNKTIPDDAADPGRTVEHVTVLLGDIAHLFAQWVSLLQSVHAGNFVYLDVKPENVLVDGHCHLIAIDFGSVEPCDPADASPVEVFFTERYAHPELRKRNREKASSNRVRGAVQRREIRSGFDYYALGVSLLEVLNGVAAIRDHVVPQLPMYRSLHFLATRLLDGQNSARPNDNLYANAPQMFPSLGESDYKTLKYELLADVSMDLDKERGRWNIEDKVPELATYSKDIVRVVPGFNTVLTPRLRSIIEHPLLARLKHVTQLGLVSLIYPTADHSRFDHSLGSYTYTTNYVRSLFNDLGNPVFRNLVGVADLKAVLLAALLHDLGQYPLAHDLEEVHDRIFRHGPIGVELLLDTTPDRQNRSMREIIEDPKHGWGVPIEMLEGVLRAHSRNADLFGESGKSFKTDVLGAIIDGPIDADKADYIIRDSSRCELPYGDQLDLERLLRVLTVAIIPKEAAPVARVTLGVYDKGLVSAHAFGQARYQLLATVYWHHTSRIAKAMLQYATAIGLPRVVFGAKISRRERQELEIRARLVEFIKALVPPFDLPQSSGRVSPKRRTKVDISDAPSTEALHSVPKREPASEKHSLGLEPDRAWYPGVAWTDWLMLQWIARLPEATVQSKNLIRGIRERSLYKRIATLQRGGAHDALIASFEEKDWPDRIDVCKKLADQIRDRIRRDWDSAPTIPSLSKKQFEALCEENLLVLIDIPRPIKKVGFTRPLGVVPELKSKTHFQESLNATEDKNWQKTMEAMIADIAPLRILCHHHARNLISAVYAPAEASLAKLLKSTLGIEQ